MFDQLLNIAQICIIRREKFATFVSDKKGRNMSLCHAKIGNFLACYVLVYLMLCKIVHRSATPIQKIRIMKRNMVKGNENRIYQINNQQYQI